MHGEINVSIPSAKVSTYVIVPLPSFCFYPGTALVIAYHVNIYPPQMIINGDLQLSAPEQPACGLLR